MDSTDLTWLRASGKAYWRSSLGMQTIDLDTYQPRLPTRPEYIDCIRTIHLTPGQERDIDKILQEAREFYAKREQV
jgi:hypothetical protein